MTKRSLVERHQEWRVLRITLNRPEKRNALNLEFCNQLVHELESADTDDTVGAIVLNANGPSFCSGMDLKETADVDQVQLAGIHERLFTMIHRIRTPIVAAVQGAAFAGGAGLVANAHIVIANPDARFALTEIRIGLWPVLIFRAIESAMGERRTVELSLTGREFNAEQAREYGLVNEVDDNHLKRATDIAIQLASFSPVAVGTGLGFVHQIRGRDWDHAGRLGRQLRDQLLSNEDFKEGTQAFLEKRQPSWPSLRS